MKAISMQFQKGYYPQNIALDEGTEKAMSKADIAKINKAIEDRQYKLLTGKDRELSDSCNSEQNGESIIDKLSEVTKIVQEHKKREKELTKKIVVLLMPDLSP
jgi:hypothetical protein